MRIARLAVVTALAGTAALGLPGHADGPQVMRGTTVVTADRSGSADLVLYQDAVLRVAPDGTSPDVSLTGEGRLMWFSLAMVTPQTNADFLEALRFRRNGRSVTEGWASGTGYPRPAACETNGVTLPTLPSPADVVGCPVVTVPKYVVIHQGHYHLRILTDGSPVTVVLRLRGLPGRSLVRPTKVLASGVKALTLRDEVGGRMSRWETTVAPAVASAGLLNVDASFAPKPVAAGVTSCLYDAGTPQLPTDHLSTSCPGGRRGAFFGTVLNPLMYDYDAAALYAYGGTDLDRGAQRLGFAATDENGVTVRSATVGWLQREQ